MPPKAAQSLESISLVGKAETAVIVGATTGIGAAIAKLYAKLGCRRIIIFGRNQARAEEVMTAMRNLAPEEGDVGVEFVKGDLSNVRGMRGAVEAIEKVAGKEGINYLVMCQNGVPTGVITENEDGVSDGFALQAVSRFALAYLLTNRKILASNAVVLSVANPGGDLEGLAVDDLSLKGRTGKYKQTLFMDQSKRDSCVLDAVNEELNARYPQYRYFHCHPGLVKSELFTLDAFPIPMRWAVAAGLRTFAQTTTAYAPIPVYIAVSPDAEKQLGKGKYFDQNLKPLVPGAWARDKKNREAVWEKLREMIGEH